MTPKGYFIDFTLLSQAHEWNIQRAKDCMLKGGLFLSIRVADFPNYILLQQNVGIRIKKCCRSEMNV